MAQSRLHCLKCVRETNHSDLATQHQKGSTSDGYLQWIDSFKIVKCLGCDEISFVHSSTNSEDFDPETGESLETVKIYPDRATKRGPLASSEQLPPQVAMIYKEVIVAMNASTAILAAIGLRALIEAICVVERTKGRNLQDKISQLVIDGYLSAGQASMLQSLRFLGNSAAHEIKAANPKELVAALDIAETLLKTIYILPGLKKSITTGKKRRRTKPPTPPP